MPPVKYYEVTQTRAVRVRAGCAQDAILIAGREFAKEEKVQDIVPFDEIQGSVTSDVEVTAVEARKEF